ncbi:peptidase M61 [Neisseriaceae bacterium PsAf]|nr:peptidase M61 [Neisseriaceae bacterium PsAf]
MLTYTISTELKHQHLWKIELTFQQQEKKPATVSLANWTPGSYMIIDFAKHVVTIKAQHDSQDISLTQLNKNSWQTEAIQGAITIEYLIYAFDTSVRASFLNNERGFLTVLQFYFP